MKAFFLCKCEKRNPQILQDEQRPVRPNWVIFKSSWQKLSFISSPNICPLFGLLLSRSPLRKTTLVTYRATIGKFGLLSIPASGHTDIHEVDDEWMNDRRQAPNKYFRDFISSSFKYLCSMFVSDFLFLVLSVVSRSETFYVNTWSWTSLRSWDGHIHVGYKDFWARALV